MNQQLTGATVYLLPVAARALSCARLTMHSTCDRSEAQPKLREERGGEDAGAAGGARAALPAQCTRQVEDGAVGKAAAPSGRVQIKKNAAVLEMRACR